MLDGQDLPAEEEQAQEQEEASSYVVLQATLALHCLHVMTLEVNLFLTLAQQEFVVQYLQKNSHAPLLREKCVLHQSLALEHLSLQQKAHAVLDHASPFQKQMNASRLVEAVIALATAMKIKQVTAATQIHQVYVA